MAAITKSKSGNDAMADEEPPEQPQESPRKSGGGGASPRRDASGKGFFTIYKKGHGYWTRMGTAIGGAFLGAMIALEIYQQVPTLLNGSQSHDTHVALLAAALFLIAFFLWAFWFTNKPSTADFLIATDSEMKKVNWTTRKELIGSTKIVIAFMFLTAIYLFVCDLVFGGFFHLIHVVKTWF